ncbi:hypothetical protein ABPG72_020322 [Tetrahymena utriculariae]
MSIKDIQIEETRQNQGEAMRSKDWEQVRNKKFLEEEYLWNDSQINIDESKQHKNKFQNIKVLQNQHDSLRLEAQSDQQQSFQLGFNNLSNRRFQFISKYSTSRTKTNTKTIEIDASNIIETSQINQTQDFMALKDQKSGFQANSPQIQIELKKNNQANSFISQLSKVVILITKIKLKLNNFYERVIKIKNPRMLSNQVRLTINDSSDLVEEKETFLEVIEKCLFKFAIFNYLQFPLISLSSKFGFYMKLSLVLLNIIYLRLFSVFFVFQVQDSFSQKVFQIIDFLWLSDLIFNLNSQIQQGTEIITSRGRALKIYFQKKFLFDLFPLILNSQLDHNSSMLLIQIFQFLKLFNINHDLKYIQLQICMRFRRHYVFQLINLIFGLFLIGHTIACLWYLIGYVELYYLHDQNSWLTQELYRESYWWQIYFSALYWSLTLISTGSSACSANLEIMFTSIIMLFSSICFGYLITIIGDILFEMNSNDLKRKQDTNLINNYMRQVNISKELQAHVNLYIQYYHQNNFQEDQQSKQFVVGKLSADLQESLKREQFKEIINQVDHLLNKNISLQVLQELALCIEEEFYFPNQKPKLNDDLSLIFIIQGELEIYNNQEQEKVNKKNKKKLGAGKNFGLANLITGISSDYMLKSSMFTHKDQSKGGFDLNAVSMQDQSTEKLNLNGSLLQNSLTFLNENQRVNFKDFDKNNREESENTKISEERVESSNLVYDVQENYCKNTKICQIQMMIYDFDQLKDYIKYFPLGNSQEVILKQKNLI